MPADTAHQDSKRAQKEKNQWIDGVLDQATQNLEYLIKKHIQKQQQKEKLVAQAKNAQKIKQETKELKKAKRFKEWKDTAEKLKREQEYDDLAKEEIEERMNSPEKDDGLLSGAAEIFNFQQRLSMTKIKRRATKIVQFIKQNNETESEDYDSDDDEAEQNAEYAGRENIEMSFQNTSEKSDEIELSKYIGQRQKEAELSDITRNQYYDSFTPLKLGQPEDAEISNFLTVRNINQLDNQKAVRKNKLNFNPEKYEEGKFDNSAQRSENLNDTRKINDIGSIKGVNNFDKNAKGRGNDPTPRKQEHMITASLESEMIIIPHQLIERD